mmetsp:Transcript_8096/g.15323  ORF Transcript_8096/g.15323 Transcript_8096/m.15323 type:complete len:758 (-) Transcript_8096:241-2514(-)
MHVGAPSHQLHDGVLLFQLRRVHQRRQALPVEVVHLDPFLDEGGERVQAAHLHSPEERGLLLRALVVHVGTARAQRRDGLQAGGERRHHQRRLALLRLHVHHRPELHQGGNAVHFPSDARMHERGFAVGARAIHPGPAFRQSADRLHKRDVHLGVLNYSLQRADALVVFAVHHRALRHQRAHAPGVAQLACHHQGVLSMLVVVVHRDARAPRLQQSPHHVQIADARRADEGGGAICRLHVQVGAPVHQGVQRVHGGVLHAHDEWRARMSVFVVDGGPAGNQLVHGERPGGGARHHERRLPAHVLPVQLRALLRQQLDAQSVVGARALDEGRVPGGGLLVGVRALLQHARDGGGVVGSARLHQRGEALGALPVHALGPAFELPHRPVLSILDGDIHGALALAVDVPEVCAALDERGDGADLRVEDGEHDGRHALGVLAVHLRALLHQHRDHLHLARLSGVRQRGVAVPGGLVVHRRAQSHEVDDGLGSLNVHRRHQRRVAQLVLVVPGGGARGENFHDAVRLGPHRLGERGFAVARLEGGLGSVHQQRGDGLVLLIGHRVDERRVGVGGLVVGVRAAGDEREQRLCLLQLHSQQQGGFAFLRFVVHHRPAGGQRVDGVESRGSHRHSEGGVVILVLVVQHRAQVRQRLDHLLLVRHRGGDERRLARHRFVVGAHALLHHHLHDVHHARGSRHGDGVVRLVVLGKHVRPGLHQRREGLQVTSLGGVDEHGVAVLHDKVGVHSAGEEVGHGGLVLRRDRF